MSDFKILTAWEDPKRATGSELRATWASLKMECTAEDFSEVITRFYDRDFNTVQLQVYGPMYPLAEWIAYHWFQMLYGTSRASDRTQDIRLGAEGFALPRLRFCSEGDHVLLKWTPYAHNGAKVEFLGECDRAIPRSRVESELAGFVGRVVARLHDSQIEGTPLQSEWQSILELDQEERKFCVAAASLGFDPFNLADGVAERITGAGALLSSEVLNEFFPAATGESVLEEAEAVLAVIHNLENNRRENAQLEKVRQSIGGVDRRKDPWAVGYEIAQRTRRLLKVEGGPISFEAILGLGEPLPADELALLPRIEGIVSTNCSASASAVPPDFDQKRVENRKFSVARLLCERLLLPAASTALVTREKTTRQKLNRAFAAELLAPADELRRRITQYEIDQEDLQDLADEFEVSTYVIENQVKNHHLARV